ncbi:MAG: excinuclease ABC subunit UvrB [Bdellovibrionota bacterium]
MSNVFNMETPYAPSGDQPEAIKSIVRSFQEGSRHHTLLGVTGSGKTFTMANVIKELGKPALIIAPNKTLAAQLFAELKALFPTDGVGFFISYYDYYQPEAYVPSSDTYIAKDSSVNEDIDKMRHEATQYLFEKNNVIIVASVSCIYGLGSPESYADLMVAIKKGEEVSRDKVLRSLIDIQYARNDHSLLRGHFRVRGDTVDILPAHQSDEAVRIEFFGDEVEELSIIDSLSGKLIRSVDEVSIYPNSHYVADRKDMKMIVKEILTDLGERLRELQGQNKLVEYQRLEQRTMQDVESFEQLGYCPGIENYSRYLTGKAPGEAPPTLLDYFPEDFLTIIDESHITVPQINGMFRGDRSRKQTLVDFGFRLPSALDNRPLNFKEFNQRTHQILYVSATPGVYELEVSQKNLSEQVIRPTGLVDPTIILKPAKIQIDDLLGEIKATVASGGRVLVTTLTKKMAEDITDYYNKMGIKIRYLHSDIDTLERSELLRDLRKGVFDVLVGINLLREGLDLPEVTLVAILDTDKEGFLRSRTSLIQTVGRAARNADARVIFYADKITRSMQAAMDETDRRRSIQVAYNEKHGITPTTVLKEIPPDMRTIYGLDQPDETIPSLAERMAELDVKNLKEIEKTIKSKTKKMHQAASNLEFEQAAKLRDEIRDLSNMILELAEAY